MNKLIENVKKWGINKGITGPNGRGTLLGQLGKTQEELTETRDAAVLLIALQGYDMAEDKATTKARARHERELIDGIGDCAVTLILAAEMAGMDFMECLQHAYDEIKGRTGRMENGTFVKDQ